MDSERYGTGQTDEQKEERMMIHGGGRVCMYRK